MELVQRLDDYGKPAWIALMVVAFVIFWPIGLAILAYMIWSGRMGCRKHRSYRSRSWGPGMWKSRRDAAGTNTAFDEYREETLQRLEEEQREFSDFLENLRRAKDKAEFDEFMASRRAGDSAERGKDEPKRDSKDEAPGGSPAS